MWSLSSPFALALLPLPLLAEVPIGGITYLAVWCLLVRRTDPRQLDVLRSLARREG